MKSILQICLLVLLALFLGMFLFGPLGSPAFAGNSLTDAEIKARVRGAFDPSNTPPPSITVSNLNVIGSLTAGVQITNNNAVADNLTVNTNATIAGTLGVTGLTTLGALSNTTLRVSGTGTIGTANVGTLTLSNIKTGAVPFTVSVDVVTNSAGQAINVLKLTP